MTAEERRVRLRKLLAFRAHYATRRDPGIGPYSVWKAWREWIIEGEQWIIKEGEHPWQTTTELDRSSSDT